MTEFSIPPIHSDVLGSLFITPPPKVFTDIQAVAPDLDKIALIISQDAGLSAEVLKTVNSSAFGLPNSVASITQATVLLGLDYVLNIVNGVLLREMASDVNSKELETFWSVSNDVALCCAYLSKKLRCGQPSEAYTLGLFHNCGIPLILQSNPDYMAHVAACYADESGFVTRLEEKEFGLNHADVGYRIAEAWNLPVNICNAIQYHHDIEGDDLENGMADEADINDLIVILKLAEHFCCLPRNVGGQETDFEWQRLESSIMAYLNLTENEIMDIEIEIDSILNEGL